jgi:ribosome-associated protein
MKDQQKEILKVIAQKLYDKKGFNILALDVREVTTITDYFLIAEGSVERHVRALYREAVETLDECNIPLFHVDGDQTGDWIVIDGGSILIHLFISELREKYALEELWKTGKIVDLKIKFEPEGRE